MTTLTKAEKQIRSEIIKDRIISSGYLIISPEDFQYVRLSQKLVLKHLECEHEFKIDIEKFWRREQRCPKCRIKRTQETNLIKYGSKTHMSDCSIKEKCRTSLENLPKVECKFCKKLFSRTTGRALYCSKRCCRRDDYLRNEPKIEKICIFCNKIFKPRKIETVCCSKRCANFMFRSEHSLETKEKISKIKTEKILNKTLYKDFVHGMYKSIKSKTIIYCRSSWEKKACETLDEDENVRTFEYEPFSIEYYYNNKNQKQNYIPDLLITYKDGRKKLVEIKPYYLVSESKNQAKFKAAKKYCDKNNLIFEIWTEKDHDF